MGNQETQALNWWGKLNQKEQNLLVELLYKLDLEVYLKVDSETGEYLDFIDNDEENDKYCRKCGKTSDLLETEDMCYTCAKERYQI